MLNYEKKDEEDFIPACGHCEKHVVYKKINSMTERGEQVNLTNLFEYTSFSSKFNDSNQSIAGRLVFTKNGNFMFLQDQLLNQSSGPRFVLVPCEISGKFKSNIMLKCSETKFSFISCWIIIRDWEVIKMKTKDSNAPLRSVLLKKHLNPFNLQDESKSCVKLLRKELLCFSATTASWIPPFCPLKKQDLVGFTGVSVTGLVTHISSVVMHKMENDLSPRNRIANNEKVLKMSRSESNESVEIPLNLKNNVFGIDDILRPSENTFCESSFSIVIRSIIDNREFTIFFPEANLLINRFTLGWRNINKFENLVAGSVLIHYLGQSPKERGCLIANKLTSITTEYVVGNIPRPIFEIPTLIQIEKVLGFGVYEIKTNQVPIKLFLHNSNIHETSIGCSISKGSILWVRNFRVISTDIGGRSLPIGIAIEPGSDWGLERHSRFATKKRGVVSSDTMWENLPLHIQTIGHEYLEFNSFCSNFSSNQEIAWKHPWDIRNLCYLHYSLYVDLFNIVGTPKDKCQILPILLVQIISNLKSDSPILISKEFEIIYQDGTKTSKNSSSLICSNCTHFQSKITHPSQTIELKSRNLKQCPTSCTKICNGSWKIAKIEEWVDLILSLEKSQKLALGGLFSSSNTLSIEFLYCFKGGINKLPKFDTIQKNRNLINDLNNIISIRCLFIAEGSFPIYMGSFGNFLAEVVLEKTFESNIWISNMYIIKTPSLNGTKNKHYPLFIHCNSKANLVFNSNCSKYCFERKFIFIKKAILRLYNQEISFFAHISDIICINFEDCFLNPPTLRPTFSGNQLKGVLLFICDKEIQNSVDGCELYFQCLPFFKTFSKLSKLESQLGKDEIIESQVERIQVPPNWYSFTSISRFVLILESEILPNSEVLLSIMQEEEFFEAMNTFDIEKIEHLVIKELIFPSQLSSDALDFDKTKSYIEIKLFGNNNESILWPESLKSAFLFKSQANNQEILSEYTVFDIKYWTECVYEWQILSRKIPLIYRSIQVARNDMINLFNDNYSHLSFEHVNSEVHISLESVKILDIIHLIGFNPQNKYGNWSIIRVTTDQSTRLKPENCNPENFYCTSDPPWSTGWIDIWFSEEDTLRHNIKLLLPGETLTISNIKVEKLVNTSPPLSPVSSIISSILDEFCEFQGQDKTIYYYNKREQYQNTAERNQTFSEINQAQFERNKATNTLSIFNNGAIIFRISVQNSIVKSSKALMYSVQQNYNYPEDDLLFSHFYFSPTSTSEVVLYYHSDLGFEQYIQNSLRQTLYPNTKQSLCLNNNIRNDGVQFNTNQNEKIDKFFNHSPLFNTNINYNQNFNIHNIPNPYVLAPDGTPITKSFLSHGKNDHASFIAFNKAYCIKTEICTNNPQEDFTPNPNSLLSFDILRNIDPDLVFSLKGSILHIQQIDLSWFCLNCLQTIIGGSVCVCGVDLEKSFIWKSLTIYLIGTLELEATGSKSKLFPFVMTNWNVIKLLAYVNKINTQQQDPKTLYHHILELANIIWDHMESLNNSSKFQTLYSFGNVPTNCSFLNSTEDNSEECKPIGIIGQVQLFDKNKAVNIPTDPITNLEMEVCLRFVRSSDVNTLKYAYLHVIRWKPRNTNLELEYKFKNINFLS